MVGATVALPLASLIYVTAGRRFSRVPLWSRQAMPVRELLTYNRMRTVGSLLNGLLSNVDMLAVQWWSGSAQVTGFYAAAKNMALIPTTVFNSGQSVILSTLAKSHGRGDVSLRDRLGRQYLRTCLYLGGLIIVLGTLSLKGIGLILGPNYGGAGPAAVILIAGVGLQLLSSSALTLITLGSLIFHR
ncbi:MAG: lipopolysaccharide biosynthesis protein [Nodosilinea sp.]